MNPLKSIANPFYGNLGIARQVSRLFFPRTYSIGTIQIDTVITEGHNSEVVKTQYPVESGATLSDHVTVLPKRVTVGGLISDINSNEFMDFGLVGQAKQMALEPNTRSSAAWKQLEEVQLKREPITLVTNLKSYSDMIIVSLSTRQNKDTVNSVFFTADLEELQKFVVGTHEAIYEVKPEDAASGTAKNNSDTKNRTEIKKEGGEPKPEKLSDTETKSFAKRGLENISDFGQQFRDFIGITP